MPSINRTCYVALRIVRQVLRDRRSLAMIVALPVAIILLLGYVIRQSHGTPTLAVVAPGGVPTPNGGAALPGVKLRRIDPADADRLLRDGDVDGVLTLGQPPSLRLLGESPGADRLLQSAAQRLAQGTAGSAAADAPPLPATYAFGGPQYDTLDYEAPALMGFFAFFFVFLLTAVSFLRERTSGTLERLLIAPLRRMELVSGYTLGFGLFALVQSFLLVLAVLALQIHYRGNLAIVFILVGAVALGSVNLGIFLSTFATTELQAIQFIPLVLVPQGLLSGLFFTVKSLPGWLQVVAHVLPLTYATDGLRAVMIEGRGLNSGTVLLDLAVLLGFAVLFVVLGAATVRGEAA